MSHFTKHIGKHNDRKVAIIYRVVPGEDHMCLLCYPDTLSKSFHDAIMRVIDSASGQAAKELSEALHRNLLPDGRPILETLHREGFIKKVPTNQIIVTPNASSHVRLDELNKIFEGMEAGDDAAQKMKDLDQSSGIPDAPAVSEPVTTPTSSTEEALLARIDALVAEVKQLTEAAEVAKVAPVAKKKATRKKATRKKATVKATKVQDEPKPNDTETTKAE